MFQSVARHRKTMSPCHHVLLFQICFASHQETAIPISLSSGTIQVWQRGVDRFDAWDCLYLSMQPTSLCSSDVQRCQRVKVDCVYLGFHHAINDIKLYKLYKVAMEELERHGTTWSLATYPRIESQSALAPYARRHSTAPNLVQLVQLVQLGLGDLWKLWNAETSETSETSSLETSDISCPFVLYATLFQADSHLTPVALACLRLELRSALLGIPAWLKKQASCSAV